MTNTNRKDFDANILHVKGTLLEGMKEKTTVWFTMLPPLDPSFCSFLYSYLIFPKNVNYIVQKGETSCWYFASDQLLSDTDILMRKKLVLGANLAYWDTVWNKTVPGFIDMKRLELRSWSRHLLSHLDLATEVPKKDYSYFKYDVLETFLSQK